jgi:hypothetical protein
MKRAYYNIVITVAVDEDENVNAGNVLKEHFEDQDLTNGTICTGGGNVTILCTSVSTVELVRRG